MLNLRTFSQARAAKNPRNSDASPSRRNGRAWRFVYRSQERRGVCCFFNEDSRAQSACTTITDHRDPSIAREREREREGGGDITRMPRNEYKEHKGNGRKRNASIARVCEREETEGIKIEEERAAFIRMSLNRACL